MNNKFTEYSGQVRVEIKDGSCQIYKHHTQIYRSIPCFRYNTVFPL